MTPLEYNTQGIVRGNLSFADLNLTEVFIHSFTSDDYSSNIDGLDWFFVVTILMGVFVVGVVASVKAGEMPRVEAFFNKTMGKFKKGEANGTVSPEETAEKRRSSLVPMQADLETEYQKSDPNETEGEIIEAAVENEATSFFLADRSMTWWFIGTSLFASNIGSEHFIGQSGQGAKGGLAVAMYEWYAAILLLLLGWVFAPIYRKSGIYTTPEFLEKRFNPATRHYLSIITCIMYVVAKLSASIYGGSLVLTAALQWNLFVSAGVCVVLSCIYTIAGGLRAVMYTDFFQTFVFVIGGFVVMGLTLNVVGGYPGLRRRLDAQGKGDFFELWKPATDPDFPFTGMMLGQPFTSIWYWCMDQDLVQRVLSGKDDFHQKGGCTMAAALKILPPFLMIVPGMAATTLFQFQYTDTEEFTAEGSGYLKTDMAYPTILTQMMPSGIRGIMIASIMAAMMSSLDSVFNAGSTIVTNDIYRVFIRPNATPAELKYAGRVATVIFAVLSIAWIPIIQNAESLYSMVVEIQGYLGPSIGTILVIGVTWDRANGFGAILGLAVGGLMGILRLIVNVALKDIVHVNELEGVVGFFFAMPFLHFSIVIVVASALLCVVGSLFTEPPSIDVKPFMVEWKSVFKVHEDSKHYERKTRLFVNGSAITVLVTTFAIWIAFI